MRTNKLLLSSLLLSTAISGVAHAQTIDYGTMEAIFGEPVTASATGKPQRASEAPVSMEIIGHEEIRRSGAKDIPQLLMRVSGVQVQRSFIGRADVSIRGYNKPYANRLLVLVNGRQVLSDAFGQVNWENLSISMNEIRQIEVVKGPNSSLFGFNAESGVINIITYSALKDDIDVAQVKLGTQHHKQVDLVKTMQFNSDNALRLSAGFLNSDDFNRNMPLIETANKNADTRRRVNADYEWQIDGKSNVRLQAAHSAAKTDQLLPYAAVFTTTSQDTTSGHITYNRDSAYGLWTANLYKIADNMKSSSIAYENELTVAKLENLFKIGPNHTIRLAGEYRYNALEGAMAGGGNSRFDYDLFAPSAMWDWQISNKLTWTNSARYDHVKFGRNNSPVFGPYVGNVDAFDRTIEEVSFNSGLAYKLSDTDTLRASVSRGLHIPSLIELGSGQSLAPLPAGFHGNPGLETERIMAYELAWDKKLNQNTNFRSAVFLQKVENVLGEQVNLGMPLNLTFENQGDSTAWGIELGVNGVYDNWLRWGANYTYMQTNDDSDRLYYEKMNPEHQVTLLGGFDYQNWEFDADLHYISGTTQTLPYLALANPTVISDKVGGYFVLNARAGYNVNEDLSVAIEGYNLIDKHREWISGQDGLGRYNGGSNIGRSVLATLTYKF